MLTLASSGCVADLVLVRSHSLIVKTHLLILVALLVVPLFWRLRTSVSSLRSTAHSIVVHHTITSLAERTTERITYSFPFLIAIAHSSFLRAFCWQPQLLTALSLYQEGCEAVRSKPLLEPTPKVFASKPAGRIYGCGFRTSYTQ
jgi:hypothetical protein